jgi:hypothetical protein
MKCSEGVQSMEMQLHWYGTDLLITLSHFSASVQHAGLKLIIKGSGNVL